MDAYTGEHLNWSNIRTKNRRPVGGTTKRCWHFSQPLIMLAMAWPRQILKSVHGERTTPRMTFLIRNLPLFAVVWWRTSTKRSDKRKKKEADKGHKSALARLIREAAGLPDLLAIRRAAFEGRFA
jgi:hypothetical protein